MSERKSGLFLNKKGGATAPGPSPAPSAAPSAAPLGVVAKKTKNVQQRWLYVGGAIAGGMVLFVSLFGQKEPPISRAPAKAASDAMVSVTPPNADKAAFEASFGQELERQRAELDRLKEEMARKDAQLQSLASQSAATPPGVVPPPTPFGAAPALPSLAPPPGSTAPVVAPPSMAPPVPPYEPGGQAATQSGAPITQPVPPVPGGDYGAPGGEPLSFDAPAREGGAQGNGGVASKMRFEKNASAGMLVPGAFAPVALLNGLDAGTSTTTQSNPQPVLLRIADNAILPGSAKYQLKSCFVLGSGYGELSSERVNIRFSRLSCVDKKNRLVLSQEVAGYLVDSDGKLGMRGVVTDRQGAKLGKALLAGFAEGLAKAIGGAQSTITTVGTETASVLGGSAALRAAGLSGAENATRQLAQFYLDEAKAIFPVITVEAGRTGTIVFTSGVTLNWSDGENRFVPQVAPK